MLSQTDVIGKAKKPLCFKAKHLLLSNRRKKPLTHIIFFQIRWYMIRFRVLTRHPFLIRNPHIPQFIIIAENSEETVYG